MSRTIYVGALIHTPSRSELAVFPRAAVGVGEEGRIAFIEHESAASVESVAEKHGWDHYAIVRAPQSSKVTSFFFPGFVDTHTHASQYPNVGIFGNSTLLDWLNTYTFPLESSYGDIGRARTIYNRVVARSLSFGTTCAAYYATVHVEATNLLADICLQKRQRALIGRVCMDREVPDGCRDESPEAALEATKKCIAYMESIDPEASLVRPVITPRFAPTCSDACLQTLGALHRSSGHFAQTHMSENNAEISLVKRMFPNSTSYADVYDSAGLLTPKTILAHCVHLSPAEVTLIRSRGTGVAHCPTSNTSLTSGAAPVRAMMDSGVCVGLGTDVSGGYSLSILEVARQAMGVSRHVAMATGSEEDKLSVSEALYLATNGGAKVVGLEHEIGSFEVGKDWDAQMISLSHVDDEGGVDFGGPVDIFGWESWDDRIAKWLYGGDDRNVGGVWVKGTLVHKNRAALSGL